MKVATYRCNFCNKKLSDCEEFIGIGLKCGGDFYPVPVEKARIHLCRICLNNAAEFKKKYDLSGDMTAVERHAWGLSW